jgi:FkbM family methyltransferase
VTVVDGGARWGVPTQWTWFRPYVHVIAFEPDPDEAERLDALYADDATVTVVPRALGAKSGAVPFYLTADRSGSSMYEPSDLPRFPWYRPGSVTNESPAKPFAVTEVDVVSLDDWIASGDLGPIDAMKLDVQGAELDILQGGTAVLETVRMLTAEVHFNQMYHGAALFGEVDALLRERGFELWRFPVVAHYDQEGKRVPEVDRVDVMWFDSHPVPVPALPGQAIWADAVYVKRNFANPHAPSDYATSVRDAAVAIGMDEPDLSAVALLNALTSAPDRDRAALEAALGTLAYRRPLDSFRTVRIDHLRDTTGPLRARYEVDLSRATLGWGWHDPMPENGGTVRWTGPQREAWLELPLSLPAATRVEVVVRAAAAPRLIESLSIEVNGREYAPTLAPIEGGVCCTVVTGVDWDRGYTRVVLRTEQTVPWAGVQPRAVGWEDYGVAVSSATLTPPVATDASGV